MVHIYYGNGKGKTTAAMGLCIRAAYAGYYIVIMQFLKDGSSSECKFFMNKDNCDIVYGTGGIKSIFKMSDSDKDICRDIHYKNFIKAINLLDNSKLQNKVILLDEVLGAIEKGLFDIKTLIDFLSTNTDVEIILTGRTMHNDLKQYADYITLMDKVKHPFDRGVPARLGIEK